MKRSRVPGPHRRRPRRPATTATRTEARPWPGPPSTPSWLAQGSRAAQAVVPRPERHPGDGRGQPEGRRRQDHLHRQRRRGAGPARPAGAGDRPRPPGQRLHGARASSTAEACRRPTTCSSTASPSSTWCSQCPDLAGLCAWCRPPSTSPAPRSSWSASWPARARLRKAIDAHPLVGDGRGGGRGALRLRLRRLPALARAADPQRAGGRREMLIPIQAEYYALEGLGQLLETVEMVRQHLNPELAVSTILLTMYDARTRLAAGVADEVRSTSATRCSRPRSRARCGCPRRRRTARP